jgi:DNA gyrase subunit B
MITALGTGIGNDDFDVDEAPLPQDHHHDRRRRRRIAHPDADPHVLLPLHADVIERGHLFIAQPPLFKVAQGKKEHYIKDERSCRDSSCDVSRRTSR